MDKQQCNIFEVVENFDIIEVTVEESEITYNQETRVVEKVITIKAEKTSRGDDKSKKITLAALFAVGVTFVGLLADIQNAVDFVKSLLT
ncbi:hypothetical protein [Enterobacter cloacae]|jgi:hypothetical protein|uniref:hypothetical protein n=1 Tax=Enterobacter cloacae TaxID=550 RepID=UPI00062C2720|nr:hypothetical protein [Enterobacter cloacae]EAM2843492.1 hypothetical protein [Salmonella enterica]ECU6221857.1 hypothetical protein [Salmonella enterica subsp. enterica serovar Idikan]EKS6306116.1 hypothetical protein [Enterobacter hormaechei]EAM8400827.1 hypothetical protein [Salmonella enterica]EAQ6012668.1 hypothetical protein [Salmonella enterica]